MRRNSTLQKIYTGWSTALLKKVALPERAPLYKKTEVAERRSSVLRLTLTTDNIPPHIDEDVNK